MIVDNPRRATEGEGVSAADFRPELGIVEDPTWTTDADGNLVLQIEETRPLTVAEQSEVRAVCQSVNDVELQLRARAWNATQNLLAYENLASPTGAETVAVVKLLCKVVRALIRMQLRRLDAVD